MSIRHAVIGAPLAIPRIQDVWRAQDALALNVAPNTGVVGIKLRELLTRNTGERVERIVLLAPLRSARCEIGAPNCAPVSWVARSVTFRWSGLAYRAQQRVGALPG